MKQPQGYAHEHFPNDICKLKKALYGLKQSPHDWYYCLHEFLISLGFIGSKTDASLFFYNNQGEQLFVLVYVDDILITGSNLSDIRGLIEKLDRKFAVRDLGEGHYFLGIHVERSKCGRFLHQRKYVQDLLKKSGMESCKPISTPMPCSSKLHANSGDKFEDDQLYRQVVGAF